MAFLSAISGSNFGRRFDLKKPETVLGRHPECDVTIDVGAVSRQHARILKRDENQFEIEDLKSRNNTFLNGQKITSPVPLHDGDLIRICDVEYSFHVEDGTGLLSGNTIAGADGQSSVSVLLVDDSGEDESSRAVSSKLDIRGSQHGSQLTSSSEARLHAVLQIAQNLGRAIQLEEVLPKVLDTLFKIFLQADRAFVVLKEGEELIPRWVKTRQPDQSEAFRISRTVMNEVMEAKQAIISLNASTDERFGMANSISDFRIRSIIVAPLLDSDDNALGAIQIDTINPKRHFNDEDLEILAGVATQAGIAIENAQMHDQLVQQERVNKDLQLARNVQEAFLPVDAPELENYSFFHFYRPADQIGGDYFDYIRLADGRIGIVTADVSGHGIAAAMLMAKLSAETRFLLASHTDTAEAITNLNKRFWALDVKMFATFLCLVLDPESGTVEMVNAGHMLPMWIDSDGHIQEPGDSITGVPIGVLPDFEYQQASIQLKPGDRLLLFTDGIHEANSASGELYGLERLRCIASQHPDDVKEFGETVITDVNRFADGVEQSDDMCLVVLSRED